MKKLLFGAAVAVFIIGCQKIQPGGNLAVLKMQDGVERYSDDMLKDTEPKPRDSSKTVATPALNDSTAVRAVESATIKPDSTKALKPATDTAPAHHL